MAQYQDLIVEFVVDFAWFVVVHTGLTEVLRVVQFDMNVVLQEKLVLVGFGREELWFLEGGGLIGR